jgi:DNA polymerase V
MTGDQKHYRGGETTGFQSPAQDYLEQVVDLADLLDLRKPGVYPVRAGTSLRQWGIYEGDILIADATVEPADGKIAIAFAHGEVYLASLKRRPEGWVLLKGDRESEPIPVSDDAEIWAIVAGLVRRMA